MDTAARRGRRSADRLTRPHHRRPERSVEIMSEAPHQIGAGPRSCGRAGVGDSYRHARGASVLVVEMTTGVGVTAAVVPRDVGVRTRIHRGLVRPDGAVDEKLDQVGAQHVPVVVMVLAAVLAHDDQAAYTAIGQQGLVECEIGEILLDREPLVLVQRDTRLHAVQCGCGIAGIVGERIRREAGWQVVTHHTTVADPRVRAPQAFTGRAHLLRVGRATSSARRLLCDDRRTKGLDTMVR